MGEINDIHNVYLVVGKLGKAYTLFNEDVFPKLFEALEPLAAKVNVKKARVSVIQYAGGKQLKVGRPKWSIADLKPIYTAYREHGEDNLRFLWLRVEFPSVVSAYKNGTTPELMITIENDSCWGKAHSNGDCGMVISIRDDIFQQIGEQKTLAVLQEILSLLDEGKVVYKKRKFFDVDGTESMLDASSSRYKDKQYCKRYATWEELSINS